MVSDTTCYDVASLTKVMVTGVLFAQGLAEKKFRLDDPARKYIKTPHPFTLRELLCHASGLPAWKPYYQKIPSGAKPDQAKEFYAQWINAETLESSPGTKAVYSDLGFILLGFIAEAVYQKSLDQLAREKIFKPLKLGQTDFTPVQGLAVAPTEDCPFRKSIMHGKVHDLNAWAMGGIAGHAGIFSTAQDVASFARAILRNLQEEPLLCPAGTLREFSRQQNMPEHSTWALSWDTPSPQKSSAGHSWSKKGIGHLGYTGCSLWLDPERDFYVVCLSNRVHPTSKNDLIRDFRPQLHDLLVKEFL